MKSSRQDLEMALDRLHEDYQHLREQLAAATRGEPFWSLFGWGKKAKAKRAAHAEETARTISGLKDQLSAANYAHHDAEIQCVKLREEIAAMTAEAARLAEKEKADTGAANAQWTQWLEMHEEELAAEKEKVANLTMSYERLHGQIKRQDGLSDELCQKVYSAHRKILAIRNMANRPVYPGGLKQLDVDLADVQDLLEGE